MWGWAAAFEAATKILPHMADAYTYWGNALQEMGRMEEASKVMQDAISKFVKGKGKGAGCYSPASASRPCLLTPVLTLSACCQLRVDERELAQEEAQGAACSRACWARGCCLVPVLC